MAEKSISVPRRNIFKINLTFSLQEYHLRRSETASIRILSRKAQISAAAIRVGTEFRGFRYLTHYHPYLFVTIYIVLYFVFYLAVFVIVWLALDGRLRGAK